MSFLFSTHSSRLKAHSSSIFFSGKIFAIFKEIFNVIRPNQKKPLMSNILRSCGLIALFVVTSFLSFSQIDKPDPIKFGKIDMADLQMTVYPKD